MSKELCHLMTYAAVFHCALCQSLKTTIAMKGVLINVSFTQSGSDVTCTLVGVSGMVGTLTTRVHAGWLSYDTDDDMKCNEDNIGSHILGDSAEILGSFSTSGSSFIIRSTALDYLEGKSITIANSDESILVCGTIVKEGQYRTAFAKFEKTVFGVVYFRQFDKDGAKTLTMSNLLTHETFTSPTWKVTAYFSSCDDASKSAADAAVFNPDPSQNPAAGNFSKLLDEPNLTRGIGINVFYGSSYRISLRGDNSLNGKHLLIYDGDNSSLVACAKIENVQTKIAKAMFSHDGMSGYVSFMQSSPFDTTSVKVNLTNLKQKAGGYHVHLYPVPIQVEEDQPLCAPHVVSGHFNPYGLTTWPAPTVGTDDQYETGDLSSKYGTLVDKDSIEQEYSDWNLPLFGKNSIVGRSIVIHRNDPTASRWVCTNILPEGHVVTGVAVFKYPYFGHVYFTQSADMPLSDTWVFARLNTLNGAAIPSNTWQINSNKVGQDMVSAPSSRCLSTGHLYNPDDSQMPMGDLTSNLGSLNIGTAPPSPKAVGFYTGAHLPLSGKFSILGKSIVIKNSTGDNIFSCATIEEFHIPMLRAEIKSGIPGQVNFQQEPGMGLVPTKISVQLSAFDNSKHRLQIHTLPPSEGSQPCADLGPVYNPLNRVNTQTAFISHDQYKVGDLSRGGSSEMWMDLNLPMTGLTSVRHRSLAVVDNNSNVVACGLIDGFDGHLLTAKATFDSPLQGNIYMVTNPCVTLLSQFQTLYNDGSRSDTSVLIDLKNVEGEQTPAHNWHVHEKPITSAHSLSDGVCSQTGPHYDPFMALKGSATANYPTECNEANPLRCELGDQARKLGTYDLGSGKKLVTDVDLPLNGMYKAQGRSIVVHVQNKGAPRYACADIDSVDGLEVEISFESPQQLDLMGAAAKYANISGAEKYDIAVEFVSTIGDMTNVKVHFLGLERDQIRSNFMAYFENSHNREDFGDYAPSRDPNSSDPDAANQVGVQAFLLFVVLMVNILFQY